MSLIDKFLEKKIIKSEEIFALESELEKGKIIDEVLLDFNIPAKDIFEAKKEYFSNFEAVEIDISKPLKEEVLNYIPVESAKRYKIVPLDVVDGALIVGMLDPEDSTAKSILQFISTKIGMPYEVRLIPYSNFKFIVKNYTGLTGEVSQALGEYSDIQSEELRKLQEEAAGGSSKADIIHEDAPIAKIVSNIIKYAAETAASDIHIEVNEKEIFVRYRIDGILKKNLTLPHNIQPAVVARIKILSRIKIDERRRPQDGRFSGIFLGRRIDFRVSTFPTYYGEKVVMRLLEQERGALPLEKLGLSEENLKAIRETTEKSFGIILVCGPTGSGKTNTLYSLLNEVDKEGENVVSLEDPIELSIPGVSQSQMRSDIGYTFAVGLRAVLRQDPDIIMVGEIRDTETAKLAIQAALTGHLVLSTIHTNTAADVPQRLIDMGVEPYLIGPTLIAVIGQRLVRTIAKGHRQEVPMTPLVRKIIDKSVQDLPDERKKLFASDKMYVAKPSDTDPVGMRGRTAVFEIMKIEKDIRRQILNDPSSLSIYNLARGHGMLTLKEDAMVKALQGVTTFDEVMRL